jgi:hypothetical protein
VKPGSRPRCLAPAACCFVIAALVSAAPVARAAVEPETHGGAGHPPTATARTPAALDPATPAPPASPAGAVDHQAAEREHVLGALHAYEAALEARDLTALKEAWPGLTPAQQQKIAKSFSFVRSWRVDLVLGEIHIEGDEAVASCLRKDEMVTVEGQTVHSHRRLDFRLQRSAAGWRIRELKE